jgi:hypothetical protein
MERNGTPRKPTREWCRPRAPKGMHRICSVLIILAVGILAQPTDDRSEFRVAENGIVIEAEYFGRIPELSHRLHTEDPGDGAAWLS